MPQLIVCSDDKQSIQTLSRETASCFDNRLVRQLWIAAQITLIDEKVDGAIVETMRLYRHIVQSASATAFVPTGSYTNRITAAVMICKAVVTCFGAPTVSGEAIQAIVKNIVWDGVSHTFNIAVIETISAVGMVGTVFTGGMPFFLLSGAVNVPLNVPLTARIFLMLACDVILILTKSFKDCADKGYGQPLEQDVRDAAVSYCSVSADVHEHIKGLIPVYNPIKSFRREKVKRGFEEVIDEYRRIFVDGIKTKSTIPIRPALPSFESGRANSEADTLVSDEDMEEYTTGIEV